MAIELLKRMTNKVGPLPAWAWAAIPAVGYIGWSYYKAAQGDSVVDPTSDAANDTLDNQYGINVPSAYLPSYGATPYGSSNLPYIDTPQYTNLMWSRQAINYLISEGVSPTDAVTAISAYINGYPTTLNTAQSQALQKAIAKLGPAPEGTSFVPGTNTTTPQVVPEAPTSVTATALSTTSARVNWQPPQRTNGAIIGYRVQAYKFPAAGATKWPLVKTMLVLPATRSFTFTGLSAGTSYAIHVEARNAKGYGPYAQAPVHTTGAPPATAPRAPAPYVPPISMRHPAPVAR